MPDFMHDIRDLIPVVFVSARDDIMTTATYITKNDESNIYRLLQPEICRFLGEEKVMIVSEVDRWSVHVTGRFAPVGAVYALAMLDPGLDRKG